METLLQDLMENNIYSPMGPITRLLVEEQVHNKINKCQKAAKDAIAESINTNGVHLLGHNLFALVVMVKVNIDCDMKLQYFILLVFSLKKHYSFYYNIMYILKSIKLF